MLDPDEAPGRRVGVRVPAEGEYDPLPLREGRTVTNEMLLITAIVNGVLDDIRLSATILNQAGRKHRDLGRAWAILSEAQGWVYEEGDRPFSLTWCCHHIGLDPEWVRSGIANVILKHFGERRVVIPDFVPRRRGRTRGSGGVRSDDGEVASIRGPGEGCHPGVDGFVPHLDLAREG